ncbi:hypothetical protein GCM10027286_08390 [Virgibacillus ainsalahensis]
MLRFKRCSRPEKTHFFEDDVSRDSGDAHFFDGDVSHNSGDKFFLDDDVTLDSGDARWPGGDGC